MDVLLPIKPKFISLIFNGSKKWEFRKTFFKKYGEKDLIFIYATDPVEKIVGYFKGKEILLASPQELWSKCADQSGLSKTDFFAYFHNKSQGYAIRIDELTIFPHRVDLPLLGLTRPPQLYSYVERPVRSRIFALAYNPRTVRALVYFSEIIKKIIPPEQKDQS